METDNTGSEEALARDVASIKDYHYSNILPA